MARLCMTAPGIGAVVALSVASTYDDASRFRRSSIVGAYLGLTPRRYESGEVSRNGRISKRGDKLTQTHLYEAANGS
jgi:transposase